MVAIQPNVYASSTTGVRSRQSPTTADRRVQLGRKVLDPPGQARVDWEVVQDIANRLGLGWSYTSAREIFDEIDPVGKIPEFKFCAIRIEAVGTTGAPGRGQA